MSAGAAVLAACGGGGDAGTDGDADEDAAAESEESGDAAPRPKDKILFGGLPGVTWKPL